MEENLIGYLLHALDPATEREVEAHLRDKPEAVKHLEKLRRVMQPLESDRDSIDPPSGLAARTLGRVEAMRKPSPAAPPIILRASPPVYSWWRRPDVLVAAVLLLAAVGIVSPAIFRFRTMQDRVQCANNMRDLHQSLVDYSQLNNSAFPRVEERAGHNAAGVYLPLLNDQKVLRPGFSTRCPSRGDPVLTSHTMKELEAMSPEDFAKVAPELSGCYAYSLGYRDADGKLQGLRSDDGDDLPILADRPLTPEDSNRCGGLRDNSPNHKGQNVLYIGGQVRFHKTPEAGRANDHIFVDRKGNICAGKDRDDTVLGMSPDRP
jgi:hypothetical protein